MTVLDTPNQIEAFRQRTLLKGLEGEIMGLRLSRGRSCYSIIKEELASRVTNKKFTINSKNY